MLVLAGRPARDLVVRGARVLDPVEGIDAIARRPGRRRRDRRDRRRARRERPPRRRRRGLVLAPAFVDPHVHLRTPGREDEETIASGTAAAAAGGYCAILAMPNTDPVVDSAAVLSSLVEAAPARGARPGRLPRRDLEGPGRRGADRDGRARRRRRRRLHRRRPPGRLRRADAARAAVRRDHRPPLAAALRGADAHPRRADARGRRLGRARLRRLPVASARASWSRAICARGLRGPAAPPHAPLGEESVDQLRRARGGRRRRRPAR